MDNLVEQGRSSVQPCTATECQCQCPSHQASTLRLETELKSTQIQLKALQDWVLTKFGDIIPRSLSGTVAEEGHLKLEEVDCITVPSPSLSCISESELNVNWSIQITSPFPYSDVVEPSGVKLEIDDTYIHFEEGSIVSTVSDLEYSETGNGDLQSPIPCTAIADNTVSDTQNGMQTECSQGRRKLRDISYPTSDQLMEHGEVQVQCRLCQEQFQSIVDLSKHSIRHASMSLSRCDVISKQNGLNKVRKKGKRDEIENLKLNIATVSRKNYKNVAKKSSRTAKKAITLTRCPNSKKATIKRKCNPADESDDSCGTLTGRSLRIKDFKTIVQNISSQIKSTLNDSQNLTQTADNSSTEVKDDNDSQADPDFVPSIQQVSSDSDSNNEDENSDMDYDSTKTQSPANLSTAIISKTELLATRETGIEVEIQAAEPKSLICNVCKTAFDSKVLLVLHTIEHSKINISPPVSEDCQLESISGNTQLVHELPNTDCGITILDDRENDVAENRDAELSDQLDEHDPQKSMKTKKKRYPRQGKLTCDHCDKQFNDAYYYKNHLLTHEGIAEFKCHPCNKQFSSKSNLVAHNRHIHDGVVNFVCDICHKPFFTRQGLTYHKTKHSAERPFKCARAACTKTFKHGGLLVKHVREFHLEKREKRACEICGKLLNPKALNSHIKHAHSSTCERHSCVICGKSYAWKISLLAHMKDYHGKDVIGLDKDSEATGVKHLEATRRGFPCHICGKSLSRAYILRDHLKTHDNVKDLKCNLCSEAFRTPAALKFHIRKVHEGEHHKCLICDKVYNTRYLLKQHLIVAHCDEPLGQERSENFEVSKSVKRTRTFKSVTKLGEHKMKVHGKIGSKYETTNIPRKYKCRLCPSTYSLQGFLKSHLKVVHSIGNDRVASCGDEDEGIVKISCAQCGKEFKKKAYLRQHNYRVHNKNVSCAYCKKQFKDTKLLKLHIFGKHPESFK